MTNTNERNERDGKGLGPSSPLFPNGCPRALEPLYCTRQPNDPIELSRGRLELLGLQLPVGGMGSVSLGWLPHPAIRFRIEDPEPHSLYALFRQDLQLSLPGGARVPCLVGQINKGISGVASAPLTIGSGIGLKYLTFHVPNHPQVIGDWIYCPDDGSHVAGRILLETDGWRVTIDPVADIAKLAKAIAAAGGYGITNVGKVERADGGLFSMTECADVLQPLRYALSFARGFWTPPLLPVGFDATGNRVHEEWSTPLMSSWRAVRSWFSDQSPSMLPLIFAGLNARWKQELWRDAISRAIWWYLSANLQAGGIDGAIVHSADGQLS